MKVKVSEAIGLVLDWLVAKCERPDSAVHGGVVWLGTKRPFNPSTSWCDGGPIIEREKMDVLYMGDGLAEHYWRTEAVGGYTHAEGPTPLVAAMRCYVASKLGGEVEVPDEIGDSYE